MSRRSIGAAPLRESAQRVDVIVNCVGRHVFLPATEIITLEEIPRTALLVDGIELKIEGLASFTVQSVRRGQGHGENNQCSEKYEKEEASQTSSRWA